MGARIIPVESYSAIGLADLADSIPVALSPLTDRNSRQGARQPRTRPTDPVGFQICVIPSDLRRYSWARDSSCGPFVLVDQPTEDSVASNPGRRDVRDRSCDDAVAIRRPQAPGPV